MKVLFTGFDAFGKDDYNPSFKAIENMEGLANLELTKLQLPTKFIEAWSLLADHLENNYYDYIILTGQAAGRSEITLEKYALNIMNSKIADNAGFLAKDNIISANAPDLYATKIDIRELVQYLNENDISSSISYHAGTFVCNSTYYYLLKYLEDKQLKSQALFVHVPIIQDQISHHKADTAFVSFDFIKESFQTIVKYISEKSSTLDKSSN